MLRMTLMISFNIIAMPPRRRPEREQEAPEGYVRAAEVQRMVQEALAAERAQQAAHREQARVADQAPVIGQPQVAVDSVSDREYERYSKCLVRFQKMRPPQFGGEPDPEATDRWVMEIEKIFKALRCPREY